MQSIENQREIPYHRNLADNSTSYDVPVGPSPVPEVNSVFQRSRIHPPIRFLSRPVSLVLLAALLVPFQALSEDLDERHERWLEEEVAYIITPSEKEVFLKLDNSRERDLFIQAFWKHRDPTPGTEKNEFRDEHYRRLNYVNRRYRYAGKPGWKTDRGKVYIILGPPKDIRIFQGSDAYYPAELWYYQGMKLHSLPAAFQLLFYQKGRVGDYILYNPAMMGPQSLLANFMEDPTDVMAAYYELEEIQPMLAQASISLIPGESVVQHPSMASMALIQNLDGALIRSIEDQYAKKFMEYKDIVEVEYSANYMDSDAQVQIIRDPSGIPFVHFALEPKSLSMGSYQNTIYTTLEFNGILKDAQGNPVYQFERTVPLNFTNEQFEAMRRRPFSFTDKFPLAPGDYRFSYLAKNKVSKEFTSFEVPLSVTADPDIPTMTPLLLGFNVAPAESPSQRNKPFVVRGVQIYSQAKKTFLNQDTLYVFFQVWSMSEGLAGKGSLRYTLSSQDEEKQVFTRPVRAYASPGDFMESIPLKDYAPGYYKIKVSLLDGTGAEVAAREESFEITPASAVPRPWVMASSQMGPDDPETFFILGTQWYNRKDYERAHGLLEKAYRTEPDNMDYSVALAKVNFQLGRYRDTLDILKPFADRVEQDYDLTFLLGESHKALSEFDRAISYYNRAVDTFGVTTVLLNALGECYYNLREREQALAAFQKSLEIDPDQEKVKAYIRDLKKRPSPSGLPSTS